MTESKPASFFHTGFHFECKEGGHEIVGHETDDISYGPCQRYADIPNQHPIDGIMHSRGHYSGHYKSERFLIIFFYCHVNVHNSMQIYCILFKTPIIYKVKCCNYAIFLVIMNISLKNPLKNFVDTNKSVTFAPANEQQTIGALVQPG